MNTPPPLPRTLVFLMKEDQILLGLKKRGFGKGYVVGIGGKCEPGEELDDAATREVDEEIGVKTLDLIKSCVVHFRFPHKPEWDIAMHVYLCYVWEGKPHETPEVRPAWYDLDRIPYDQMWDDSQYMVPLVLSGKKFTASFTYNADLKVSEYTIRFTDQL